MRVRVVPIQARRVVLRNLHGLAERLPGPGHHAQDVVLRRIRRDRQSMKVQICHIHARGDRTALPWVCREVIDVGDLELVPWRKPQRRSVWLAVIVKRILTIGGNGCVQSEGKRVIFGAK